MRLHRFQADTSAITPPDAFTFPFRYSPHPLSLLAADEVSSYLQSRTDWAGELAAGKMMGVLVVRTREGELGFLAAFSGNLAGSNDHAYFVPPVADLLAPDGFFRPEEARISALNARIAEAEASPALLRLRAGLAALQEANAAELRAFRSKLKEAKRRRDARRSAAPLTAVEEAALVAESQFLKAEERRLKARLSASEEPLRAQIDALEADIEAMKRERRERSAKLQKRMFEAFGFLNARGERRTLDDIFASTVGHTPPAGAGECAGPKLLQYAYLHGLEPLCMAEFWWGASPATEVRRHGHFYPACQGKCFPILSHMLRGLSVEPDPLLARPSAGEAELEVLYEDAWLIAVCKPSGLLSVPGRQGQPSAWAMLCRRLPPDAQPLSVHRLDMDTSGILLMAKTPEVQRQMHALFRSGGVRKRYVALLDGIPANREGVVCLPLRPDWADRPRQMVCRKEGKAALTRYEVIEVREFEGRARVALYPLTGRTHQLRVHASHHHGLDCPISGDALYGRVADRLCLHAEMIEFRHPVSGLTLRIERPADF